MTGATVGTPLAIRMRRVLWTPLRLEACRHVACWNRAVQRGPEIQSRVLRRIFEIVEGSDFARDHGLDRVRTLDDLRRAMPIAGYERAEPYIQRVREGDLSALFGPDTPVHMFALTSGTTGTPKYIPVTDALLKAYREGWHVWGVHALNDHYDAFGAKLLQLASRMDEESTPSGVPAGAMSGLTAQAQRRSIRWLYIMPPESAYSGTTATKYYLACRLGLQVRRLMPLTANPSTLLGLARTMDEAKDDLLRDLSDGTLRTDLALDREHRARIERALKAMPDRARALERIVRATGHLYPKDTWDVPLIGTWKGGTLELYLRRMPEVWGDVPVRDIGLLASEGRFSVPLQTNGSAGVLDVRGTVFEFLPEEEAGRPDAPTLLPHETQVGERYFLVLTTPSGLFRYDIGDLVEVTGRSGPVPVIRFLNKGGHVSSLTGEKLTEHQVVTAVNGAVAALGLPVESYCLCPVWDEAPCYDLLVEEAAVAPERAPALAEAVERALVDLNIEYAAKRASGRLDPIRVRTLPPGTWHAYDTEAIDRTGGRVEQYKHKFLVGDVEFERRFPGSACYRVARERKDA